MKLLKKNIFPLILFFVLMIFQLGDATRGRLDDDIFLPPRLHGFFKEFMFFKDESVKPTRVATSGTVLELQAETEVSTTNLARLVFFKEAGKAPQYKVYPDCSPLAAGLHKFVEEKLGSLATEGVLLQLIEQI